MSSSISIVGIAIDRKRHVRYKLQLQNSWKYISRKISKGDKAENINCRKIVFEKRALLSRKWKRQWLHFLRILPELRFLSNEFQILMSSSICIVGIAIDRKKHVRYKLQLHNSWKYISRKISNGDKAENINCRKIVFEKRALLSQKWKKQWLHFLRIWPELRAVFFFCKMSFKFDEKYNFHRWGLRSIAKGKSQRSRNFRTADNIWVEKKNRWWSGKY